MSLGVLVLVGAVAYEWHQERTAAARSTTPGATSVAKAKPAPRAAPAAPVQVQAAAAPAPVAAEKTLKITEKPLKTPETAPAPRTGPNRLVIRTEGEAWIEIRDAADRMLISSLNPPGSERVVRGKPPYSLVIGNASQVTITYDDKPVNLAPHTRQDVARLTLP
jgi:cytoskeleton protein RodZ